MPKKKVARKKAAKKSTTRAKARRSASTGKWECDVCGTTIAVSKGEVMCVEDMICCGQPMKHA